MISNSDFVLVDGANATGFLSPCVPVLPVVDAPGTSADQSPWPSVLRISRDRPGIVEVEARDAFAVFRSVENYALGVFSTLYQVGPTGRARIPVPAGSVDIQARATASAAQYHPEWGGLITLGTPDPQLRLRWRAGNPQVPRALSVFATGTGSPFGPAQLAATGVCVFRPLEDCRRALVRTTAPAMVSVVQGPGLTITGAKPCNGGPVEVACGPWDAVQVTAGAAACDVFVSWLPEK